MDQVKEYLAVAIKHGFWIGSSVVLIGALAVWFLSTSDLNQQIESQINGIESDVQKVSQFDSELPTQPNDLSHQWMNEMIDIRKEEVLLAWQNVFNAQRDLLRWPQRLKDDFLDEFKYVKDPETGKVDKNKLKLPFEKYELFGEENTDKVVPSLLRQYEKYIGEVLPSYAAICGAEWKADFTRKPSGGMAGMGDYGMDDMMGMGSTPRAKVDITGAVEEPVVVWSESAQDALLKDLFPWRGAKEYPSELDVYYSQENLWILQQLLEIVKVVNGDAKQSFEANIREIKKLSIGRSVRFNQGNISDPGSRVTAGFGGMDGGYEDMEMMGMGDYESEVGMSMMGPGEEDEGTDPGENRYVNTAFEPIPAADLRAAFNSNDPGQVAIAVVKRLPVMLHLQMDQRSIPKLLAACGSAPLMVDVHQVRVMPKSGSSRGGMGGGMGGYGGMGGMEEEMMGGMGGYGDMGGMGGGMGGGLAGAAVADEHPLDMDVEIYGLIYFFNPPSEESLGIDKVEDDVSIDESAEVIDALPGPAGETGADSTTTPPAGNPSTTTAPADPAPTAPGNTAPGNTNPADTTPGTNTTPGNTTPGTTAPPNGTAPAPGSGPPATGPPTAVTSPALTP